jgi:Na+-transporting NADH:ubiquinone oxidoreductase subunit C
MKAKLRNLLFILVLGSICALILLGIREFTLPRIERYHELKLKSSILDAAGITYTAENLNELFYNNIKEFKKGKFVYYLSPDNTYIFKFKNRGLWGMIEGLITLNADLKTIESIRIISQEETPGLGGRISEESFLAQFKKKILSPELVLVLRRKASRANEVDAISGASMTSSALVKMINESVKDFRRRIQGE